MPELPEVETVVRDLCRARLVRARIVAVRVSKQRLRIRWLPRWKTQLLGRRVEDIRRRGKWIYIRLDDDQYLMIHLGMTGQLTVQDAGAPLQDHTHVVFDLDDQRQLRFRDIRRFGSVQLFADWEQVQRTVDLRRLGPEPWDVKPAHWRERLAGTARSLKAALLDQTLVAGVGNIYADESLFEAQLPPTQLGRDTTPAEADRLRRAIVKVLRRAILQRGSSIRNYVGGSGLKGQYQEQFRVYGRTGEPCRTCEAPIARIRLAGRSTHFCPRCQVGGTLHASSKRR